MTLRQHIIRQKLEAVERILNELLIQPEVYEYYAKRRHNIIVELNRMQLEEWNYD